MKQGSNDGRFLHGQKWERFSVQGAKADFYVSSDGNDSWSGTLPSPNASYNDGPFATIEHAQEAVCLLKQRIYTDKKPPSEKRYIGSPHKYGDGRDTLVLIRGGYYSLDKPLLFGSEDGGERVETDLPTGAFEFNKLKDYFVTYLDAPGEWFFDANTGKLSYIPSEGINDPNDADIVTPMLFQLMMINSEPNKPIRNLRFYGLTFEATNFGDSAISF